MNIKVVMSLLLLSVIIYSQGTRLILRFDDSGMSHSVNSAIKEIVDTGIPFSTSVMFACPWYQEACEILASADDASVGIHLTLNAEWKNYRWGPVLGKEAVPSLVDSNGFFFPSRAAFYANNPRLNEIEAELRAQIERALSSGLRIDYIDYHMGTAVDKPEYRDIVERLAEEYKLGISRYFGEMDTENMYDDPIDSKSDSLVKYLGSLDPDRINLMVIHVGIDNPELAAMEDLNPFGPPDMSKHRQAELNAVNSSLFRHLIDHYDIELINYRDLIKEKGLGSMVSPLKANNYK
jgi:predicted glycoside hydrolase/deacetylase ChbG (UPF0249 family)